MQRNNDRLLKFGIFFLVSGFFFLFGGSGVQGQMSKQNQLTNPTMQEVRSTLEKGPGRDYSTGPLWVWNDLLTEEQIRFCMRDFAAQNVKQVWVHPRPGLMTPYLSGDEERDAGDPLYANGEKRPYKTWFDLWRIALEEAENLDMNVWIYDENSYPSGFAGGFVPEIMPEARATGINLREVESLGAIGPEVVAIYQSIEGTAPVEMTETMKEKGSLPKTANAKWLVATLSYAGQSQWYGNKYYVNLIHAGVTEKFLDITLGAYKRQLGDQFGKRIPGSFTDEPNLHGASGLPWAPDLPERFQEKYGYSLIKTLPALFRAADATADCKIYPWQKVRFDYNQLVLDLFISRWAKPYFEFCEENDLELTGHYFEHDWPHSNSGPDDMAMYLWHQRPAIDLLMNTYSENINSHFGNVRSGRELASAVNQAGRSRTLSENFGAGGWDLTFEDIKRLGDWSIAMGVNTVNEHLSYITIRGARKHDHPQSFSYHASWWNDYQLIEDYFTDISYLLSQGKQINRILVIEPTTTAWIYRGGANIGPLGNEFASLLNQLEVWKIGYDLGSEDIIARIGKVGTLPEVFADINLADIDLADIDPADIDIKADETALAQKKSFDVGVAQYQTVVLSKYFDNIRLSTLKLLADANYNLENGRIICLGNAPLMVDGLELMRQTDEVKELFERVFNQTPEDKEMESVLKELKNLSDWNDGFSLNNRWRADVDSKDEISKKEISDKDNLIVNSGKLFKHIRTVQDGKIVFLCNSSQTEESRFSFEALRPWNVQASDLLGNTSEEFVATENSKFSMTVPPAGSLVLFLQPCEGKNAAKNDVELNEKLIGNNSNQVNTPNLSERFLKPSVLQKTFQPMEPVQVNRTSGNILPIDYMDVTAGIGTDNPETKTEEYFYRANGWLWQKNGYPKSPWDNGVQFRDTLLTHSFEGNGGFSVTYKFELDPEFAETVSSENPLFFVVERADLFSIQCNGKPVEIPEGQWYIDRAFNKLNLSDCVKGGENSITFTAEAMSTWVELMPAYLVGNFALKAQKKGFLVQKPEQLSVSREEKALLNNKTALKPEEKLPGHSAELEGVAWLSSGINFANEISNDPAPQLTFLINAQEQPIVGLRVWNYAERNLTERGINECELTFKTSVNSANNASDENDGSAEKNGEKVLGSEKLSLTQAPEGGIASEEYPQTILFAQPITVDSADSSALIQADLSVLSNHRGFRFPIEKPETINIAKDDSAFVGLAEIQFLTKNADGKLIPLKNVKVQASSELSVRNHRRLAQFIVDGSGLSDQTDVYSWCKQGMPFYDRGVAYTETFDLGDVDFENSRLDSNNLKTKKTFEISLNQRGKDWFGSLARVIIDGKTVGRIAFSDQTLDITEFVHSGKNTITVEIIGTPKNLFGPHHAGKLRGSAWPGSFHGAPAGIPSGNAYDVIDCGLFKPFVIQLKSN